MESFRENLTTKIQDLNDIFKNSKNFLKTSCIPLNFKTNGLIMGYVTLVLRSMTMLSLIFVTIKIIISSAIRYKPDNDSPYLEIRFETENLRDYLLMFGGLLILAIGVASSIGLILGVTRRCSKFIVPYLIYDVILTFIMSVLWLIIVSNFHQISLCTVTILTGEFYFILNLF